MGLFSKKPKQEKPNKEVKGAVTTEIKNQTNGFTSPTEFLKDFEKTREFKVQNDLTEETNLDDISKTVVFSLYQTDLVSEEDKKVLDLGAIQKIVEEVKVKAISAEQIADLPTVNVKRLYDEQIKAHKALLRKIPKLRAAVEEEVATITSKVPRIKQQKIRKLRRDTDKKISILQKEINDTRIRISVLKEQINQMARKFKSIEKQIVENKASDRSVMNVVASLSDENSEAIKANLKNFSDSELTEKSRNMYNSVLVAIRQAIGNIKVEIDKLTAAEEEKVNTIKELEFDFQISSGRHSSITKDLKFAIKREAEAVEKLFELVLNVSSENVSILQRKYNKMLIDKEEELFQGKMDQMIRSIESTKMGLNFSKEITEITKEVDDINAEHLDDEAIQEMTREVQVMIKGESKATAKPAVKTEAKAKAKAPKIKKVKLAKKADK